MNEILRGSAILPPEHADTSALKVKKEYSTRLFIVRHGESAANAVRVFLGHTNLGLSPRGEAQARATAELLRNEPISAIYSSDLIRAYNTALPNAELHGLEVIPQRTLRELYIGEWENMKIDDIIAKYGEKYTVGWKTQFGTFTPPSGESIKEAGERFFSAVLEIARRHEGECVLITAHAAVIRAFYSIVAGIPWDKVAELTDFPYNASVTTVYFDGNTLLPGEYSHSAHLSGY